jgi:hypothetical protein
VKKKLWFWLRPDVKDFISRKSFLSIWSTDGLTTGKSMKTGVILREGRDMGKGRMDLALEGVNRSKNVCHLRHEPSECRAFTPF